MKKLPWILIQYNISIMYFVLLQHWLDQVFIQLGLWTLNRQIQATFLLLLEINIWRWFIQPNTEPLQLVLDNLLVTEWLQNVQTFEKSNFWNFREKTYQIKIKWHVRATAMTCLPRPLPSFAPSIIPGKSSSWIFAPYFINWMYFIL